MVLKEIQTKPDDLLIYFLRGIERKYSKLWEIYTRIDFPTIAMLQNTRKSLYFRFGEIRLRSFSRNHGPSYGNPAHEIP